MGDISEELLVGEERILEELVSDAAEDLAEGVEDV